MDRRDLLKCVALAAAGAGLAGSSSDTSAAASPKTTATANQARIPFVAANDGTALYYKDWGSGKPVLFVASWAMSSDLWQYNMTSLVAHHLRCVAYDRRGHGRSSQLGSGYDYDTLADDLAAVIDHLDLHNVTLVGHSMGPGEIVRYMTRHGRERVERVVLVAPTLPFLLKTPDNPSGVPGEMFEQARVQWRKDFPKWLADKARAFVVPETSQEMLQWAMDLMKQASLQALIECNHAIVETDFRRELPNIKVPTLIIQGDKDVSAPLELTGRRTAELIPRSHLEVYEGGPHGLMLTHMDRFNADLLAFIKT